MAEVEITCIKKSGGYHENPNEAVSEFGWLQHSNGNRGKSSRTEMVEYIINGNKAFVLDDNGHRKVYCYVRTSTKTGIQFLQTYADNTYTNNLLDLDECD